MTHEQSRRRAGGAAVPVEAEAEAGADVREAVADGVGVPEAAAADARVDPGGLRRP